MLLLILPLLLLLITILLIIFNKRSKEKFKNNTHENNEIKSNFENIIKENYKFDVYDMSKIDEIRIKGIFKESFDWATNQNQYNRPCLLSPKDQGYCGSCWAVILTSMFENAYFRSILAETDKLKKFSIQQFLDCYSANPTTENKPCNGCDGCVVEYILNTLKDKRNLQLCSKKEYDYTSFNEVGITNKPKYPDKKLFEYNKCKLNTCGLSGISPIFIPGVQVYEISVPEIFLDRVIYRLGPLYIPVRFKQIDANYKGIYTGDVETSTNHAVIITGWGVTKDKKKYWIIQNSWGKDWSNNGYAWLPRSTSGKYGKYGKNNISYRLYSVNILRPPPCLASIDIEKIHLTYLPNTKSACVYKINAYIPDDSYVLDIKIKSTTTDNTYLSEITDSDSNLLQKVNDINIKVVNNPKNYDCHNKAPSCPFKQDFSYIFKANVDKILYNNWNIICSVYKKPDLITSILTINKEITWGDINIIINNIDMANNTITYIVLKTIDYTEDKYTLQLIYNEKNVIYSTELNSNYVEGTFVKNAEFFNTNFINNPGLYEFYIKNSVTSTLYSNTYKSIKLAETTTLQPTITPTTTKKPCRTFEC
jgi:hypothetical protein